MKLSIFVLFVLIIVSSSKSNLKKFQNKKASRTTIMKRTGGDSLVIVTKTTKELADNEKKYATAQKRYETDPDGTDTNAATADIGYELYFKVEQAGMLVVKKTTNVVYQKYYFQINKNALYYLNQAEGYRGVLGSLNLKDIWMEDEDPETSRCCRNVEAVNQVNKFKKG